MAHHGLQGARERLILYIMYLTDVIEFEDFVHCIKPIDIRRFSGSFI